MENLKDIVLRFNIEGEITEVIAPLTENDLKSYRKSFERFEKDYKPQYWDLTENEIIACVNLLTM